MNIFKTFELFLSEPISVIKKRVVQILHVEMNIFARKLPMTVDFGKDTTQITVFNNEKVYNLLTTVLYKKKQKEENEHKSQLYHKRTNARTMP